ncbi:MAG: diguanylate cyclase [Rhizobiaceae bacterium]|nr:diguanylate cyclase [Rhizobiaceae bacterium]
MQRGGSVTPFARRSDVSAEERAALFDYAFEASPIGVALVDTLGIIVKANTGFGKMLGRSQQELTGTPFSEITYPEDLHADLELFQEILSGRRDGYKLDKRYVRSDGKIVETSLTVIAMRNSSGEVVRFLSQIEDVTEKRRAERELAERAAQLELAMEAVRGGFWNMDIPTQRFETSDRLAQFIGGPEAARMDLEAYAAKVNAEDYAAADLTPLLNGSIDRSVAEYRLMTVEGERWMRCDRRLLRDEAGRPLRIVGVVIDYTEEHAHLMRLETKANTDVLTGLLNRRGLYKRFSSQVYRDGCALLLVDLDGFKAVNDQLGHSAGDAVLIETALRLRSVVRDGDAVSRLGGDEFVVLINGSKQAAEDIAQRVLLELSVPIEMKEGFVLAQGSVGGAWSSAKPANIDLLIACADAGLYEAKARGKNTSSVNQLEA